MARSQFFCRRCFARFVRLAKLLLAEQIVLLLPVDCVIEVKACDMVCQEGKSVCEWWWVAVLHASSGAITARRGHLIKLEA